MLERAEANKRQVRGDSQTEIKGSDQPFPHSSRLFVDRKQFMLAKAQHRFRTNRRITAKRIHWIASGLGDLL